MTEKCSEARKTVMGIVNKHERYMKKSQKLLEQFREKNKSVIEPYEILRKRIIEVYHVAINSGLAKMYDINKKLIKTPYIYKPIDYRIYFEKEGVSIYSIYLNEYDHEDENNEVIIPYEWLVGVNFEKLVKRKDAEKRRILKEANEKRKRTKEKREKSLLKKLKDKYEGDR